MATARKRSLLSNCMFFSDVYIIQTRRQRKRGIRDKKPWIFAYAAILGSYFSTVCATSLFLLYYLLHTRIRIYCFSCWTAPLCNSLEFNRRTLWGIYSLRKYLFAICRSQAEESDSSWRSVSEHPVWSVEKSYAKIDFKDHEDFLDRSTGLC